MSTVVRQPVAWPDTQLQPEGRSRLSHLGWIAGAALLAYAISSVFSGVLQLSRGRFLVPYFVLVTLFLEAYRRWTRTSIAADLQRRAVAGLAAGAAVAAFTVWSVLRQPSSPRPAPTPLVLNLTFLGFGYGVLDAFLLSILPVAAAWRALTGLGLTQTAAGRALSGALAVLASVVVTAAWHLGFAEFHGARLLGPLVGCGLMSIAYVAAKNPLAAIVPHVAMHVAAVLHGLESTVQLPPH